MYRVFVIASAAWRSVFHHLVKHRKQTGTAQDRSLHQTHRYLGIIGDLPITGVSHFSALEKASQRENIQKISENAIAGWVIVLEEYGVMESIPTYASR